MSSTYSLSDVTVLIGANVNDVPALFPVSGVVKIDISFPNKKWEYAFGNKGHAVAVKKTDSNYFEATISLKTGTLSLDYLSTLWNNAGSLSLYIIDGNGTSVFESTDCRLNLDGTSFEESASDTDFMVIGAYSIFNRGGN